jgi:16S rRNA (uracil1498-N3)-methyltransferase
MRDSTNSLTSSPLEFGDVLFEDEATMARRVHVTKLSAGEVTLGREASHHLRTVLRLGAGAAVEVFDDSGAVAQGEIVSVDPAVVVRIAQIDRPASVLRWTVASVVPKGGRADWMIEKLSELGVSRFQPISTARSVVTAEGASKRDRWSRLAAAAAEQSHRAGVMEIAEMLPVTRVLRTLAPKLQEPESKVVAWCLSTRDATPIGALIDRAAATASQELTMFIGPEGGWTEDELRAFAEAGVAPAGLTRTILRVETAAVAAAAVVGSVLLPRLESPTSRDS